VALSAHKISQGVPNRAALKISAQAREVAQASSVVHEGRSAAVEQTAHATSSASIAALEYGEKHSGHSHCWSASSSTTSGSLRRSKSRLRHSRGT
jgi:hypothetical protein